MRSVRLLLAALAVAGCGSPPATPPPVVIEGVWWRAVSIDGRAPAPEAAPAIRFAAGRVEGFSGCNSFGGDARMEAGRLVVGEVATTLILCEGEAGRNEAAMTRLLQADPQIGTDGARLVLRDGQGEIGFVPGMPPQAP